MKNEGDVFKKSDLLIYLVLFLSKMSIKVGLESGEHKKRKFSKELPKTTNMI